MSDQQQPMATPFCRDCEKHVRLTAFALSDDFACSDCEGSNWYFDNAAPACVVDAAMKKDVR